MKVAVSMVTKVWIPESDDLDPITVYLENYEPSKGKITIECWGKAWSAAWPAMSKRSVEQFFVDSGTSYLAGYLDTGIEYEILNPDMDELRASICKEVFAYRRTRQFDKVTARDLYDRAQDVEMGPCYCTDYKLLSALYGDDWYECSLDALKVPNQKYVHLCRVIEATKEGLKAYLHQQTERQGSEESENHDSNFS